jgi:FG-GAP-like repeat/ASPIC and UnbV
MKILSSAYRKVSSLGVRSLCIVLLPLVAAVAIAAVSLVLAAQSRRNLSGGPPPMQVPSSNRDLVAEVSGGYEAQYFFQRLEKPPDWNQNLAVICELKQKAVEQAIARLESNLAGMKMQNLEGSHAEAAATRHHTLAQLYAFKGQTDKAIERFQEARRVALSHGLDEFALELEERLGIAQLRRGEDDNCVKNHHARSCIFPISVEGRHGLTAGSQAAINHFLAYLDRKPNDLEVKWLLNIAYMTLGQYPGGVPQKHLIPAATFDSKEDIGRSEDVASSAGLDVFGQAGGAVMDDFDKDGFLDIAVSTLNSCEPLHLFRNNGDGSFTDKAGAAGLSGQLGGLNVNHVDYDNDGWLDLYVMRGGWDVPMRNSLLRNNGDGTFIDVTEKAKLARPATATQTAAWADIDNDGHIDLFVGNENAPCQLFRNNGNGSFEDVAHRAGVDKVRFTKGVVAGDYDNDGYADFYVSNGGDDNFLYHNNQDGTFTDVAQKLGVEKPSLSFATWFFDYDNDGLLDLFVTSFLQSVTQVARSYLGLPVEAETLKLYRNTGAGGFRDVTQEVGLDRVFMPMGCNFGDVDNDGFLDFYLGTGAPSYAALVPNVLFRNHNGKYFVDITTSSGTGHLQKGHGVAIGDLNNDGNDDIFVKVGGAVPGDKYASALFKNPGRAANNWIKVRLAGVKTNRAAIGARLKVTVADGDKRRSIHRTVTSGGSFGDSPFQQHIGLAKASKIETLEIWWPASKTRTVFHNLEPNQVIEVKEFAKEFVKLSRRPFSFKDPSGQNLKHPNHNHNQ